MVWGVARLEHWVQDTRLGGMHERTHERAFVCSGSVCFAFTR